VKAWESEKSAVNGLRSFRLGTSVDNCKEACGPERGAAISREGNALKGRKNPRNGCGTKQGREARVG
jgi:hypothetical protein